MQILEIQSHHILALFFLSLYDPSLQQTPFQLPVGLRDISLPMFRPRGFISQTPFTMRWYHMTKPGPMGYKQKCCGLGHCPRTFPERWGESWVLPLPSLGELEQTSIGEPHYKSNRQKVPGSLDGLHLPRAVWLALVCERENVFYLLVFWSFFVYTDLAYMPKCPAPLHYFPNIPWIFLPSTLVHAKASVVNILPPHLRYLNSPQRLSSNSPSSAMLGLAPLSSFLCFPTVWLSTGHLLNII